MKVVSIRKAMIMITVLVVAAMAGFTVQSVYAAGNSTTKATTKAAEKPKTVSLNIILKADKDAEVELIIEKKSKKKSKKATISKTVNLKKGMNYFTYNKGKKGNYTITMIAFGDTVKQEVTAVQGAYTIFFSVAPPKDGDNKNSKAVEYQDLTKLK